MTVVARIVSSDPVRAAYAETVLRKAGVWSIFVERGVPCFLVELRCRGKAVTVFDLKDLLNALYECG